MVVFASALMMTLGAHSRRATRENKHCGIRCHLLSFAMNGKFTTGNLVFKNSLIILSH
jgi:hypothetical protein